MENERVLPADDFLAAHTGLLPVQKRKIFPSPDALMSVVGRQKKKSQPPPGLLGLSLITKVKQNGKGSAVRSSRARWRDGGRISTKSKWEAIDSCCCVLCVKKAASSAYSITAAVQLWHRQIYVQVAVDPWPPFLFGRIILALPPLKRKMYKYPIT